MDRRKIRRNRENARHSLEQALGSWRLLRSAWQSIFDVARGAHNYERMALAESKLEECQDNISRLETALEPAHIAV